MTNMTSDFAKHIGLAHKVFKAGELVGFTPTDWNTLAENPILFKSCHDALLGHAEIKAIEHLIDFDATPFIPDGWSVLPDWEQLPNRVRGKVKFDPAKVKLHLDDGQKGGGYTEGNQLRQKLADFPVYGSQLLDFYLANPHLIPEEWGEGKYVFFWGTIYRRPGGWCVRCLYRRVGRWYWEALWLDVDWGGVCPAALRAS